ncbi:MAG: helix-turn-helix domain-containing protein [Planctomycetaceae bacterium]
MTTDQKLMTVKEVAHFLRLSLAETYRLVNTKSLTHFRVGPGRGAIRISEQDVLAFLENRRQGREMLPRDVFSPRRNSKPLKHIQVKK